MTFDLAILQRNVQMDVLAIVTQKLAKNFVIAFTIKASHWISVWINMKNRSETDNKLSIDKKQNYFTLFINQNGYE